MSKQQVWFLTGSQHLYGPETLEQVAEQSAQIQGMLSASGGARSDRISSAGSSCASIGSVSSLSWSASSETMTPTRFLRATRSTPRMISTDHRLSSSRKTSSTTLARLAADFR